MNAATRAICDLVDVVIEQDRQLTRLRDAEAMRAMCRDLLADLRERRPAKPALRLVPREPRVSSGPFASEGSRRLADVGEKLVVLSHSLSISESYCSQLMSAKRRPSLEVARRIESRLGIPMQAWAEAAPAM